MFGGEARPASGLSIVGREAHAFEIAVRQAVLSRGETLFGGSAKPPGGLGVVDGSGVAGRSRDSRKRRD